MKKITTLIIISSLFWIGNVNAQFSVDWAHDYSHTTAANFSNEGSKIAVDTGNGFIYTLNDVTSNLNPSGVVTGTTYSYTILSQFDNLGALIESVTIDVGQHFTTGFDMKSGFGLQVDNSGNVYIGYTNYNAVTFYDVNLAKYDSQLNQLWSNKFNAASEDVGIAMEVSAQGTAFAILKSNAGANIRHRIVKANASGTSAVALYTYSTQPDYLADLVVDAVQNVYTTGYRLVGGVKSILMSCVNSTGTLLWSRVDNCGTITGDDFSRDINIGDDDFLYITGSSQGTVQHGIDAFTMKYNPANGKKMWESFINFNLTDGGFFVINPDPNYVYVSWLAGSTIYIDQISAITGVQIRRINYAPTPVSPYNSLGAATITGMKLSKRQNIYITGSIAGVSGGQNFSAAYLIRASFASRGIPQVEYTFPVTGDAAASFRGVGLALDEDETQIYFLEDQFDSFTSHSQEAIWLVSIEVPAALRLQHEGINSESTSLQIETWPNPVTNEINIRANNVMSHVEISDVNGKVFLSEKVTGVINTKLDVTGLSSGMYFVKIQDAHGITTINKFTK